MSQTFGETPDSIAVVKLEGEDGNDYEPDFEGTALSFVAKSPRNKPVADTEIN